MMCRCRSIAKNRVAGIALGAVPNPLPPDHPPPPPFRTFRHIAPLRVLPDVTQRLADLIERLAVFVGAFEVGDVVPFIASTVAIRVVVQLPVDRADPRLRCE